MHLGRLPPDGVGGVGTDAARRENRAQLRLLVRVRVGVYRVRVRVRVRG